MARLSMDDLLAECIALKGLPHAGNGARGAKSKSHCSSSWAPTDSHHDTGIDTATGTPPSPPPPLSRPSPTPHTIPAGAVAAVGTATDGAVPWASTPPAISATPDMSAIAGVVPSNSTVGGGAAGPGGSSSGDAMVMSVGDATLPDGEYPPEAGSLRIIGETFGCVIDVAGEAAAESVRVAVAAAVATSAATAATVAKVETEASGDDGRGCSSDSSGSKKKAGGLRPVGSMTPMGKHDVLIWGPAGAVAEAKEAVAALVSGKACAEVVVGAARIRRRDRGFWVNCEVRVCVVCVWCACVPCVYHV